MNVEFSDIVIRLLAATAAGLILGINRELQDKPAGLRTHAIVALGSAIITLLAVLPPSDGTSASRALQGVITGVGFLGAGVILRTETGSVRGLTTAGTIWLAASFGAACGLGYWSVAAVAAGIALLILILGVPVERQLKRTLQNEELDERRR
ncbi:MAG TPA: MgtC/SapB family protein [Gemmatimonadaceae bacterium]|nr:MgtC/SapB family protein [Gemmatimonadaceae bacterium]